MSKRKRKVTSLLSDEMDIGGTYWQDTQDKIKGIEEEKIGEDKEESTV